MIVVLLATFMSPPNCILIYFNLLPCLKKIIVCSKFISVFLNVTLNGSLIHTIEIRYHFSGEKQLVVEAQTVNIHVLLEDFAFEGINGSGVNENRSSSWA